LALRLEDFDLNLERVELKDLELDNLKLPLRDTAFEPDLHPPLMSET
jgi:hypothetical protein